MARLISKKFSFFLFFLTGLTVGILIGVSGLTALISYRIDGYHQTIKLLQSDIEDKGTRLQKLEEKLNQAQKEQKDILKEIIIQLELEEDQDAFEEIEMVKHIKEKYAFLIGREVETIDMDIIGEILDKRIFRLGDGDYQLAVEKIYLSEILKLWVRVNPLSSTE